MSTVLGKSRVACVAVILMLASGCGTTPPEESSATSTEAPAPSPEKEGGRHAQKIEPVPSNLPLDPSVASTPKGITCASGVVMKEISLNSSGETDGFDGKIELLHAPRGKVVRIEWRKSKKASAIVVDDKQWGKVTEGHEIIASYMYTKEWLGGFKKLILCSRGGED